MSNQDLKSRFSAVVTEFFNTNPLCSFWKKEQNGLDFCAQIQGVKVSIEFIVGSSRVKACVSVGKYRERGYLYHKISFSLDKKSFASDFKRLAFDKVENAINEIVSYRNERKLIEENFEHKLQAFRRYFPFEANLSGRISTRGGAMPKKLRSVELSGMNGERDYYMKQLTFSSDDTDFLMKICACVSELLKQ
ncbi:hypothetical protein BKK52_07805 [Rodentibacter trehalosifermentans]|uniref:Uncharacterized protein n=1 Tax=Rodentibacter trehalosifermentans TaxID=1908263 RepID=A0A1V3IZR0_9PAST|nr:hypothetical protein [Rodentibacter trehalosifermentans]OOF47813.1 hypothetical protein BKK52_07805 [Rodentibacter trehalosifermentans]